MRSMAQFDAALAGRAPIIPQQVFREFITGGGAMVPPEERLLFLTELVESRGGAFAGRVADARMAAMGLRVDSEMARSALSTPTMPKKLGYGDSLVVGSAEVQGLPVLLSDAQALQTLRQTGVGPTLEFFH